MLVLAERRRHAATAVGAFLERDADQVAAQVVRPRVVDALEVLRAPGVVQRDQRAAMGAAVLERVDLATLAAHDNHGHLAHERRPEVAGLLDVRLEAHVVPHGPFEDAAQLRLIVLGVLVHPVRNAGEGVSGPRARRDGDGHDGLLGETIACRRLPGSRALC